MTDYNADQPCGPADLEKDPNDTILVTVNWASVLNGDTIATSSWELPDGMTEGTNAGTGSIRTCKVSGGDIGRIYRVVNRITTTTGGLQFDKTTRVLVRER